MIVASRGRGGGISAYDAQMRSASHTYEPLVSHAPDEAREREIIVFDREAVRRVDRAAIEEYGISGVVLMENAARGLADHAMRMLGGLGRSALPAPETRVLIVCGSGNNGGDGYALARHLHNRGIHVSLASLGMPKPDSDAGINQAICQRMQLPARTFSDLAHEGDGRPFHLIVDGIFGTGLDRDVSGEAAEAIDWINRTGRQVLVIDVPSGMDCNTGRPLGLGGCVKASLTVTFAGLKTGFLELDAQKLLGEVVVADIGVPRELLERFGRRIRLPRRPEPEEHHRAEKAETRSRRRRV
jgi:NAD(P)H-hydrate epimerase